MAGTHVDQAFVIELDGKAAGRLYSFSGGGVSADVITMSMGVGGGIKKHISSIHFQDMVLTCGTGMSRVFYDWLSDGIKGSPSRKNGAIVALNYANKPVGRLEFKSALVKSIAMPKLEANINANAVMNVTIAPELARSTNVDPKANLGVYVSRLPKPWKESSFKLSISGLEKNCSHIQKIESILVTETPAFDNAGNNSTAGLQPGKTDYSDLVITLPDSFADGFRQWADDSMIKGNSDNLNKTGTLEFFAPSISKTYFTLSFDGLGISGFGMNTGFVQSSGLPVTARMYYSGMTFSAGSEAIL